MKKPEIRIAKIDEFRPVKSNPNRHTQRGEGLLENSMQEDGYVAPMTASADGAILDGNARLEKSATVFGDEVLVIEHDGTRPLVAIRTDIESEDTPHARRIVYRANRVAQLDLEWDLPTLEFDLSQGVDLEGLFSEFDLQNMGSIYVLGENDNVDKEDRAGSSPWNRVSPSGKIRAVIGDIEFGISEDALSFWIDELKSIESKSIREAAEEWFNQHIQS